MPQTFVSWIPTVSGRLSYSHIGESSFPAKCTHFNEMGKSNGGQAIVCQTRYTDDFVLPLPNHWSWLRNKIVSGISRLYRGKWLSGKHEFIAVFDSVRDQDKELDYLEGRVYPVLYISGSNDRSSAKHLKDIRDEVTRVSEAWDSQGTSQELSRIISGVKSKVSACCPIEVKFTISRNGITELQPVFLEDGLLNDCADAEKSVRDYIEQSFFFLRDISHNHQHHEPESDTIIRVHPSSERAVRDIYFDLFRYIIRFKSKRFSDPLRGGA